MHFARMCAHQSCHPCDSLDTASAPVSVLATQGKCAASMSRACLAVLAVHTTLQANTWALGGEPYNASSALPYLFKVLSIAKALSVQAHPHKKLAEVLHARLPAMYKDDNHKPELACALTPFEAMCGFRSASELRSLPTRVPEIVPLLGEENAAALACCSDAADDARPVIRAAFTAFMSAPAATVATATAALALRLAPSVAAAGADAREAASERLIPAETVAARLCIDFPGDVGVFSPFWLNTVRLQPGEALFLAADEPHAYLSGNAVEVMAASDNVVRAGLTPKFKDVATLCDMLTYAAAPADVWTGTRVDAYCTEYAPPVTEFVLQRVSLPRGSVYNLPPAPTAAISIVIHGRADVHAAQLPASAPEHTDALPVNVAVLEGGDVTLQAAHATCTLSTSADEELLLFRAFAKSTAPPASE